MTAEHAVRRRAPPPEDPIGRSFAVLIPQEKGMPFDIGSFDRPMEQAGLTRAKFVVVENPEEGAVMHVFDETIKHRDFWTRLGSPEPLLCGGLVDTTNFNDRMIRWISGQANSLVPELRPKASNAYKMEVLAPRLYPHFSVEQY